MIEAPMSEDDLDVSSDYLEEYHGKDAYNDEDEDQNEDTEEEQELVEGERQAHQNQQSDELSFNPPAAHAITKPTGDKTLEESKGEPFDL